MSDAAAPNDSPAASRVFGADGTAAPTFAFACGDEPMPEGDVVVSLQRLRTETALGELVSSGPSRGQLVSPGPSRGQLGRRLGVVLQPEDDVRALGPWLQNLKLVCLAFPTFREGRPYTHARLLREELGWQGPIRAVGHVKRDQMFYMYRCGVTEFALSAEEDIEGALAVLRGFSVAYQAMPGGPAYRRPGVRA